MKGSLRRFVTTSWAAAEAEDDLLLELELPFWIEHDAVGVAFGERQLAVDVRNTLRLRRTYWRNK